MPPLAWPFADGCVLRRGLPIPVWGSAEAGSRVAVILDHHRADAEGRWQATLPPQAAGGPHALAAEDATGRCEARDVLVGEVWSCAGQANLEWLAARSGFPTAALDAAHHPRLRLLTLPLQVTEGPAREPAGFPTLGSWRLEDGAVHLRLEQADGLCTRGGGPVRGFAIAGPDRVFRWAEAEIVGDGVVVRHPLVPEPVEVRYAWDGSHDGNLINADCLPCDAFRAEI